MYMLEVMLRPGLLNCDGLLLSKKEVVDILGTALFIGDRSDVLVNVDMGGCAVAVDQVGRMAKLYRYNCNMFNWIFLSELIPDGKREDCLVADV